MFDRESGWAKLASHATGAAFALVALVADPAHAVDGVIEINAARAAAGSITPGDNPGFPAQINAPGSYRLTSDLNVPASTDGIWILANNVTLDLNGFTVFGGGGSIADGISIPSVQNVEVRNGTVRGFSRHGIFTNLTTEQVRAIGVRAIGNAVIGIDLGTASTVDGCTALNNGVIGIRVNTGSLVINSVSRGHPSEGLNLGIGSGYRSNVVTGNNGGDANPQVSGGIELGTNLCGTDTTCP